MSTMRSLHSWVGLCLPPDSEPTLVPPPGLLLAFCSDCPYFCKQPLAPVKNTPLLPLQVLGTAKNAVVVWIGVALLGETVTPLQGVGYAISLGGFVLYNYLKMQDPAAGGSRPQPRPSPSTPFEGH